MTIVREKHSLWTDVYYEPYVVWWVENPQGELIKILYITFYDDNTIGTTEMCGKQTYLGSLSYYTGRYPPPEGCPNQPGEPCVSCPTCPHSYGPLVDGVTGCTERNSETDAVAITRTWDMTDRQGNPVRSGTYHLRYSGVFADEQYDPGSDKVFEVMVTLRPEGFDTTATSPPDIAGTSGDAEFVVPSIRVVYGGSDSPGSGPAPAEPYPEDVLQNVAPPPPTVEVPEEPGFCGSGSVSAACVVLVSLRLSKRRRKRARRDA
jgi:hypothetical protein